MNIEELKYIELKTGYSDNGPAWIGYVTKSKTGQTLYFNDKAFKSQKGYQGAFHNSNYFELKSKDDYWISGVKKQGTNRRSGFTGKTYIEKRAVSEYCKLKEIDQIQKNNFEVVVFEKSDIEELTKLMN